MPKLFALQSTTLVSLHTCLYGFNEQVQCTILNFLLREIVTYVQVNKSGLLVSSMRFWIVIAMKIGLQRNVFRIIRLRTFRWQTGQINQR